MNYGDTKGVTASCVRDFPLGGVARLFSGCSPGYAPPLSAFCCCVTVRRALVFLSACLVVRLLLRRVFLLFGGACFVLLAVVLPCFALFCCG